MRKTKTQGKAAPKAFTLPVHTTTVSTTGATVCSGRQL